MNGSARFRRYLPPHRETDRFGWRLIDSGSQVCGPGEAYPPSGHPESYLFDRKGRRVLQEFQLVVLTQGEGVFSSDSCAETPIQAGDAFLLFPGEGHQYAPEIATGWRESWTGFDGPAARRMIAECFTMDQPVFPQAAETELIDTFARQLDLLNDSRPGAEEVAASLIPHQLALLRRSRLQRERQHSRRRELVIFARAAILRSPAERTDFVALAAEAKLSYSRFRKLFRAETGYGPRAYENILKLNRARDLLRSGRLNVNRAADELGYNSVAYFSRAYKSHFGHPPSRDFLSAPAGEER